MKKYGPSRGDLKFRLWFSVAGLAMLAGVLIYRGLPRDPAGYETIGLATLFFGGTFVWTLRKLIRKDHSDGL
ncbi:MAG: hypothetical protein AAFY39_10835 [Pseudomonadota bacterium]